MQLKNDGGEAMKVMINKYVLLNPGVELQGINLFLLVSPG